MTIGRAQIDFGGNNVQGQAPGARTLSQEQLAAITTVGNATITAVAMLAGIIQRTGPTGAYSDTFPSAEAVLLAQPELSVGDSFKLVHRNTVAFAMTAVAGEGVVLGTDTGSIASAVRELLVTILGTGPRQVVQGNLTNASAIVTGLPLFEAARIQAGQGVTGTNVPANTFVTSINAVNGTMSLSANATGTGVSALTIFPRYRLDGVRSSPL